MQPNEQAQHLISAFGATTGTATEQAILCVDVLINDLEEGLQLARYENMHGHVRGLLTGSIMHWKAVKHELESQIKISK